MTKKKKETNITKTNEAPAPMTIRNLLASKKGHLAQLVPKHLTVERLLMVAMTTINKTPKLAKCTTASLLKAVMDAGQLGLEPNGIHAYLIPYWNSKSSCYEAQFQVGYRGLMQIARRAGDINFSAEVVYENDHFDYALGLEDRLEHIPCMTNRGEMVAAYAIAKFGKGEYAFKIMFAEDILKIKSVVMGKSKTYYGPWKDHEEAMWKKTVLKQLCKLLPESVEMQTATAIDDQNSFQDSFPTDEEIIEIKTNEKADDLKQRLNDMKSADDPQTQEGPPPYTEEQTPEANGNGKKMHLGQKDFLNEQLKSVVDEDDNVRINEIVDNENATFAEAANLITELTEKYDSELIALARGEEGKES